MKRYLLAVGVIFFAYTINAQTLNINGTAGSGRFGAIVKVLSNGNYVVADPEYDEGAIVNVGAVYLYNGSTNTLISTLKGSTANDNVGQVIPLTNGNFAVISFVWDNGAITDAGAVTWCNGTTGLNGVVSISNSLVGSAAGDYQAAIVTALSNGNYVIQSQNWDNGAAINAGAATWANGTTGIVGVANSTNSLVGSNASDIVGQKLTLLTNGNYVVSSSSWRNGAINGAGAVTWCNGATGRSGVVSSSNSLVGSTTLDALSSFPITPLTNGNYVIPSPAWDDGAITNAGAVTWANGTTGITGTVSSLNSLVGTKANDQVGSNGVTALTNGNYVVNSPDWAFLSSTGAGASTWGNGSTGITGAVTTANSLVGSRANDRVGNGNAITLTNGNYVVRSSSWDNGSIVDAGFVIWGNGTTGIAGAVTGSNSFVGTETSNGNNINVTALANGNYIIRNIGWDNGVVVNVGAVAWGNGSTGITGTFNTTNSLIGGKASDAVGSSIKALSNGNYVVVSGAWDAGAITDVGAVTWGNGTTGTTGTVSISNSLIGSKAFDGPGSIVETLQNGNYVAISPGWDNGANNNVGAATWCNGATGTSGEIQSGISLIGSTAFDQIGGSGFVALSNGNYVVVSLEWDDGSLTNVGALTWGNGNGGTAGLVSSANSLIGNSINARVGNGGISELADGNYIIRSTTWDNGAIADPGAITLGNGATGVTGQITSCNSVIGSAAGGGPSTVFDENIIYNNIIIGRSADNIVSIYNPAGMPLANTLDVVSVNISGNNTVPLISSSGCRIFGTITPVLPNPVTGIVDTKIWIETSVPNFSGQPFVARHYQIKPANNAAVVTGKITLFFTQQEFTNYNNDAGSTFNLPAGAGDAAGIGNLRIAKYNGSSSDDSGLPGSYTGSVEMINPDDADIKWNSGLSRWEVTLNVTGFSGFFVQGGAAVLPLKLLSFTGAKQGLDATLQWSVVNAINVNRYEVERSENGRDFITAGTVTSGNNPFLYTDKNIFFIETIVYYRLKTIDNNGKMFYSGIVRIVQLKNQPISVFPNPAKNIITVSGLQQKGSIKLLNADGKLLLKQNVYAQSVTIDIEKYSSGTYLIQYQSDNKAILQKVIKR